MAIDLDGKIVLEFIKYAGLAVAGLSSAWSLLKKTTYEDETKTKHLTREGQFALLLVGISSIISLVSFGFESVLKHSDQIFAAEKIKQKQLEDDEDIFRQEQRDLAQLQAIHLQRVENNARLAEERSLQLQQRFLTLEIAAEQQNRDLALAKSFNIGSTRNLQKSTQALQQIGRLIEKLGPMELALSWKIPLGNYRPRFASLAYMSIDKYNSDYIISKYKISGATFKQDKLTQYAIPRESPLYPTENSEPELLNFLRYISVRVVLIGNSSDSGLVVKNILNSNKFDLFTSGDIKFRVEQPSSNIATNHPDWEDTNNPIFPNIFYNAEENSIYMHLTATVSENKFIRGGIISVSDLEKSTVLVDPEPDDLSNRGEAYSLLRNMKLTAIRVTTTGRIFGSGIYCFNQLDKEGSALERDKSYIKKLHRPAGRSVFVVSPLDDC